MKKQEKDASIMKDLLSNEKEALSLPQAGDLVKGKVIKISKHEVIVALDRFGTGIIYGAEIKENRDMLKGLEVGQEISALVVDSENDDGYIELSLKEANIEQSYSELENAKRNNDTVTVKVTEANRGGLVIRLSGIIGFLPVSQLSPQNYPRVEGGDKNKILKHLNQFIGQEMKVKIISLDKRQEKLIVSEKSVCEKEIKENLSNYKEGDVVEGTVTALADFGAFIKFDDQLEGLAHISELAWQIIDHPNQILKENESVKAQIIDISDGQVSLSLRALKTDPWHNIDAKFKNGQKIQGKVIKFNPSGAFIEVDKGIHGLVHNTEFAKKNVSMEATLAIGQKHNFEILSISPQNHKMSLGLGE